LARQSFVKGAAILTLAGISVRLIGALFRIVLAMLIADEGIGLFQMAYPIYTTLLAVSTAGIPIAISKLVAENMAKGNYRGALRVFHVALAILAISGLFISVLLYLGAGLFARTVVQDPRAYLPLVSISPAIFLVTLMSAYRGFFQGQQQMLPTALSQIAEQVGRVVVALILVLILLPRGLEYAAAGASFGAAAGAFTGLLILLVIWQKQKKDFFSRLSRQRHKDPDHNTTIAYNIFALSIPITLGSLVMPVINIVDLSIVPQRLHMAGFETGRATALYGQLTGMAGPLVHIPTIITVALAISLVPAISEALALQRMRLIQERSYMAIRMTMLLALPSAAGLYLLAEPITVLLFQNAEAGLVLAVLSFSVLFLTLYQTTSGILQGLGKTMDPVISLLYGAAVKTVLTWTLTSLPDVHIRGAALATVIGFGVAAIMNVYKVQTLTGTSLRPMETIIKPLLASTGMAALVIYVYKQLEIMLIAYGPSRANAIATLSAITVGAAVYVLLLFLLGVVQREDLEAVPKIGRKMARLAAKLHLLRG
jgi:stage V sporulation protein B